MISTKINITRTRYWYGRDRLRFRCLILAGLRLARTLGAKYRLNCQMLIDCLKPKLVELLQARLSGTKDWPPRLPAA